MAKSTDLETVKAPTKGKRGRPKGSTNLNSTINKTGKRGRPSGSTNKGKRGRKPKGYFNSPTFQVVDNNLIIRLPEDLKQVMFITNEKKRPDVIFIDL